MAKRSAEADLREHAAHVRTGLLPRADIVLLGYRPGALDRFGLGVHELAESQPGLIVGSLSAWGDHGPWGGRPGFDSIVLAASGIAVAYADDRGAPGALPVQALDIATGYRLAAAVIGLLAEGRGGVVRASLLGAARTLLATPSPPPRTDEGDVSMGVPLVTVSSPHGTLFLPPPPLLVDRRTLEHDVGGYGLSPLDWR
jgi:crotonobetainyl-CoA:carnitine CoA-transferase CaiB-like acyl-CoA transferase